MSIYVEHHSSPLLASMQQYEAPHSLQGQRYCNYVPNELDNDVYGAQQMASVQPMNYYGKHGSHYQRGLPGMLCTVKVYKEYTLMQY